MQDVTTKNFGLLIAYLIPGFIVVGELSRYSPTVQSWLASTSSDPPTVGGFLYATIWSVGTGLIVSTMRFLLVDRFHHATGVRRPDLDFSALGEKISAFDLLNEQLYRYYQFYGNTAVAVCVVVVSRWSGDLTGWIDGAFVALVALLLVGSRDTLRKYYTRTAALLR